MIQLRVFVLEIFDVILRIKGLPAYIHHQLIRILEGTEMCIRDRCTAAVELDVTILAKGRQEGTHMYGEEGDYGGLVSVSVKDKPITIVVTDNNHSFVEKHQMDACGIDWDDYDVIVVKQGYIHPELKEKGKLCIMSLTDGATLQDTKRIPFKLIKMCIRDRGISEWGSLCLR